MSTVYALLLVVLAVGVQSQVPAKYQTYPCTFFMSAVMYPYYEDCNLFIQCDGGVFSLKSCPTGTVADFGINNCVPTAGTKVLDCAKLVKERGQTRR